MKHQKGFSLIELLIVIVIIGVIAAIAIPNLLASRRSANEATTVSALRTIHGANITYQSTTGVGRFAANLTALNSVNLIDELLASATTSANVRSGYYFTYRTSAAGTNPSTFDVDAQPSVNAGVAATGSRSFLIAEPGVIYTGAATVVPICDPATRSVTLGTPFD